MAFVREFFEQPTLNSPYLAERIDDDEIYETESHLLYVACTQARDGLLVSGVKPGSEFLLDLEGKSP